MFCCNVDMLNVHLTGLLTDAIDGIRWWGLSTRQSFIWLVIFSWTIIFIQLEERYRTWIGIYRSLLIKASRLIIWFWYTLIYNMQRQLWKSKSISYIYSYVSFWRINWYVCNLISLKYKPGKVLPRGDFSYLSGNFFSRTARFY